MVIKTHDISRLRFLDFDTWPMVINLKFDVCNLQMEQDIVAVFGEHRIQVFQILKGIYFFKYCNNNVYLINK